MTDEKTDPRGFPLPDLPEPSPSDYVRMFGEVVTSQLQPVLDEQKKMRHLMAVLSTGVTAEAARLSRRVGVVEATRIAPAIIAIALSVLALGMAAGSAQAGPVCPPGIGGAP